MHAARHNIFKKGSKTRNCTKNSADAFTDLNKVFVHKPSSCPMSTKVLNIYSVNSLAFGHLIFLRSGHLPVIFTLTGLPQTLHSLLFKHQLRCTADHKHLLTPWFITHHSNRVVSKSKHKGTQTPEKEEK